MWISGLQGVSWANSNAAVRADIALFESSIYDGAMLEASSRILAIETSSRSGSAALGTPEGVVATGELDGAMRHAAEYVALVRDLLDRQQWPTSSLTHILISIGPGSFTGLRIGVTMARTLSWATGARVVAVPTLEAIALNALEADPSPQRVAVLLDAKRQQVYAGAFELRDGQVKRLAGPILATPAEFLRGLPDSLSVMGEGVPYHADAVAQSGRPVLPEILWRPRASQVFKLGLNLCHLNLFTAASDLIPLYIRRPEAEEKWEKIHGTSGT